MRGAVPTQRRSSLFSRDARALAGCGALVFACSCSVYSSSLVDDALVQGGGSGSATAGSSTSGSAGKSSNGGTSGQEPGAGGEGGEGEPAGGTAGSGGSGGSGDSGSGNTSGAAAGGTGTGGSAGTAGSSGTGGTDPLDNLLDGFEDNDLVVEQVSGRGGVWYTFHDKTTGTMTPSPLACSPLTGAPAELGMFAMHITATGFSDYGSGLGTDFRASKKLFDASSYTGIRFWAKIGAAGKNLIHRVQVADVNTDADGKHCDPAGAAGTYTQCDDHFGSPFTFTTDWKQYELVFAKLKQLDFGYPGGEAKLDTKQVYGLQITAKKSLAVDLWIDQIEFY